MSPAKRNSSVASLRDFFAFLSVLTGEHPELELSDVRSSWLIAEFQRVLRAESRSLASKTPELKNTTMQFGGFVEWHNYKIRQRS